MKTDNIRIKRKNSDFLLYGVLYLLLVLVGIFLIGLPFLSFAPSGGSSGIFLVVLGILCVGAGGALYGLLLYRGLCPQDALIITNKGLTNYLLGGKEGVYIEWTNVSSMKVFGLSKAPMLGLSLEDNDSYLSMLSGRNEREAQANLEVGLPIIAIAQKDIFLPIGELKNLFSRMIKGALSWETYNTQNKKPAASAAAPAGTPAAPDAPSPAVTPVRRPSASAAERPRTMPIEPHPSAAQASNPARPLFTPVAPVPDAEPPHPATESSVLKTLLEDLNAAPEAPAEPPKAPKPPVHNDSQEEIILLDIDND